MLLKIWWVFDNLIRLARQIWHDLVEENEQGSSEFNSGGVMAPGIFTP